MVKRPEIGGMSRVPLRRATKDSLSRRRDDTPPAKPNNDPLELTPEWHRTKISCPKCRGAMCAAVVPEICWVHETFCQKCRHTIPAKEFWPPVLYDSMIDSRVYDLPLQAAIPAPSERLPLKEIPKP